MTINKAQGQSISGRLGIYLPSPVFAHGQLYVAFSRGISFANVRVLVIDNGDSKQRVFCNDDVIRLCTLNIVDRSLLASAASTADSIPLPAFVSSRTSADSATSHETIAFHASESLLRSQFSSNALAYDDSACTELNRPPAMYRRIRCLNDSIERHQESESRLFKIRPRGDRGDFFPSAWGPWGLFLRTGEFSTDGK